MKDIWKIASVRRAAFATVTQRTLRRRNSMLLSLRFCDLCAAIEAWQNECIRTFRQMNGLLYGRSKFERRGPQTNSGAKEGGPLEICERFWRLGIAACIPYEGGEAAVWVVNQARHLFGNSRNPVQYPELVIGVYPSLDRHFEPKGVSFEIREVRHNLAVGVFNLRIGQCPRKVVMVGREVRAIAAEHHRNGGRFQSTFEFVR